MSAPRFTDFFIRRPAFTVVVSLVLVIVGAVSVKALPVRWVPAIQPAVVAIYTACAGASANLVETRITTPIEGALASVDGIDTVSSSSHQGASTVILQFLPGRSLNAAIEDVRSALQSVSSMLPPEADVPLVQKADPNSTPMMLLAFSAKTLAPRVLSDYVKQFLLPRIQSVDGVGAVTVYGRRDSVVHVWLDPLRMAASGVTVTDVGNALTTQNAHIPSGSIKSHSRDYPVVAEETLTSPSEFNALIVRNDKDHRVRLGDVADTRMDAESSDTAFRANGQPVVALSIIPQSTANPLEVAKRLESVFQNMQATLPAGMSGKIVFNASAWIRSSIHHVYGSLIEAIILVLVVVYLFLGQLRAAVIPLITIPVCLMGTFALMRMTGVTLNTITLMAFVLAIGLVVDDAIVVLENCRRHIEQGKKPFEAALIGSREMIFPVVAMTLTLVAVYAPAAFVIGLTGTVFREFAVTLAGAVLISGGVALTLSPMMCARLLESVPANTLFQRYWHPLQRGCERMLSGALARPFHFLALLGLTAALGVYAFHALPSELVPSEDMDEIEAYVSAPRNASFAWTDAKVKALETLCQALPGVDTCLSGTGIAGSNKARQIITLQPKSKRHLSLQQILERYQVEADRIAGIKVSAMPASSPLSWYSEGDGSTVAMKIMSPVPWRALYALTQHFIDDARGFSGFIRIDSGLKWDGEQFDLTVNRERAVDLQVSIADITHPLSVLLAGRSAGYFERNGNLYDIRMQMNRSMLADPDIFSRLYVRNSGNQMISLAGLADIHESTAPERLTHFDRLRADTVYASLTPGVTLAEAVHAFQRSAARVLPDNARFAFVGDARTFLESGGSMFFIFSLALVFIYLTLVAQFESFYDPLIVLLTVPFALTGALVTLWLTGGTLNLYSDIALVTLIGLIAKHGILVTEFANRAQLAGAAPREAAVHAVNLRLRPVLMTTAAMVLGALPLALAMGPGAESRHQAGWVIVGGLLPGTFFSLIVVPFAFVWRAKLRRGLGNGREFHVLDNLIAEDKTDDKVLL